MHFKEILHVLNKFSNQNNRNLWQIYYANKMLTFLVLVGKCLNGWWWWYPFYISLRRKKRKRLSRLYTIEKAFHKQKRGMEQGLFSYVLKCTLIFKSFVKKILDFVTWRFVLDIYNEVAWPTFSKCSVTISLYEIHDQPFFIINSLSSSVM